MSSRFRNIPPETKCRVNLLPPLVVPFSEKGRTVLKCPVCHSETKSTSRVNNNNNNKMTITQRDNTRNHYNTNNFSKRIYLQRFSIIFFVVFILRIGESYGRIFFECVWGLACGPLANDFESSKAASPPHTLQCAIHRPKTRPRFDVFPTTWRNSSNWFPVEIVFVPGQRRA